MPSGPKKRRQAKQRKDSSALPESAVLEEKNTDSEVHDEQLENPSSPNTPVRDGELDDRDIYSQADELVTVVDLDVGGFSLQTKEPDSGNDIANARSHADKEIVSQGSNVEGLDEIETDEIRTCSMIENDREVGDTNLNFNDELNTSQLKVAELLASDRDRSESISETKSQDQPMQYMEQEATPRDPSSVADGKSVTECMLEITKDGSPSVLQGSMLESAVKQIDPLLNVTEKQTLESVGTVSYGIDDGSLSKCFKQSCEASFMNESFVSECHESSQILESIMKTKHHEDAEDKHIILNFGRSERCFPSTEGQTQHFDDERLYEDERSGYKSHAVLTTEESNVSHDLCSSSLVVETTQEVESTGNNKASSKTVDGNDEQTGSFELTACNVCLSLDELQGDATTSKDSISMFNEFSELDCPDLRNIGRVGDNVCLENNSNSTTVNEDTCALKEPDVFELKAYNVCLPLDALQGDTTNAKDGDSNFNAFSEVDHPAVRNIGQAGDDVCLPTNSSSRVENENSGAPFLQHSLSGSEKEHTVLTKAVEVTCVNVPLSGSAQISKKVNGNPALMESLLSISSGSSELSSTLVPSHLPCEAAYSTEKALPGEAEHSDVYETIEIATSIRDELSQKSLKMRMPELDCQMRYKNIVEPVMDYIKVGAIHPTSGEGLEPESEILKPDVIDENQNSNEGLSRKSLETHDDATELNNASNLDLVEQNQPTITRSYDNQTEGWASWKGCCGVLDWLSGQRG